MFFRRATSTVPVCLIALAAGFPASVLNAEPVPTGLQGSAPEIAGLSDELLAEATVGADIPLYLLVVVNERATDLLAEFTITSDGRISSPRSELMEVGIKPPRNTGSEVLLDQIPGLEYVYDEALQTISISAPPSVLIPREITARQGTTFTEAESGYGAVLNYQATANFGNEILGKGFKIDSAYAALEGRVYSPLGVLSTTGDLSIPDMGSGKAEFRRYETTFTYSNPHRLLSVSAGDITTSTLPWTRPIRLGGLQLQRDFSLRSDIVTSPLLSYNGTAAVPSTIDVYVESVRAWSGEIEPGPFSLTDLPVITPYGEAVIVMKDDAGNEHVSRVPFLATRNLLKAGQLDFSVEVGRGRENFGIENFSYGDETLASASFRRGITDRLTFQGHVERSRDLLGGSLGISTILLNRAEITIAAGMSRFGDAVGYLGHLNVRTELAGVDLQFTSTRRSIDYADLAYATGVSGFENGKPEDLDRLRPETALDTLSVSMPLSFDNSRVGLGLINSRQPGFRTTILSASYSKQISRSGASVQANGFADLRSGEFGLSASFSVPLGEHTYSSAGLRRSGSGRYTGQANVARHLGHEIGSYGYNLDIDGIGGDYTGGRLEASYRSRYGYAKARLAKYAEGRFSAAASFEGSVVVSGGGVLLGNYVHDSFAVVDVGLPGVPVHLHNRPVAKTGIFGKALVPNLVSYSENRISIDPQDLPIGNATSATATTVVPARRSGVTVDFGGDSGSTALVTLRDAAGEFIPLGSRVMLKGPGTEFYVGYDGEVWLEGLKVRNTLIVESGENKCTAEFHYHPNPENFMIIENLECL